MRTSHRVAGIACLVACWPTAVVAQAIAVDCDTASSESLHTLHPWRGVMPLSGAAPVQCLEIVLKAGEGVRAVATMDTAPGSSGVRILVYAPGEAAPALQIELGNLDRVPITWRAEVSGAHHLVVRDAWSFARGVTQVPVSIWIEQVEPPALADARDAAVSADPRVGWLRQNAVEIRSIDPQDTDFSDLQSLRSSLEGVRLVLLAEADHRSGSDFLAKSRLVKFLHQELGFDVLAFDAPIYGMAVAWDHMRSGMAPREAFAQGAWGFWANSEQMRPLIEYVAEQAQGERPIELAGIDRQFLVGEASARFAQDLVTFLVDRDLSDPLALPGGSNMHILESLALRRYDVGGMPLPDSAAGAVFLDGLEQTIARAAALDDRGARFWTQVMRSTACYARFLVQEADPCDGSRQRAQNVIWLVNEYFLGHRIIVWTGVQAARMPELPAAGGSGPSMGYYLDEVLGTESYAIGLTSYRSAGGHIVTDQHQLPEFEELMSAAGFNQALLDLRRARAEASWAGEEFLARPILYGTLPAVWSDLLDALLFVREHHPSVSVR